MVPAITLYRRRTAGTDRPVTTLRYIKTTRFGEVVIPGHAWASRVWDDEGIKWILGHHDPDCDAVQALLAAHSLYSGASSVEGEAEVGRQLATALQALNKP